MGGGHLFNMAKQGIIIDESGRLRSVNDIEFAEEIIKKRKGSDPWAVIEKLVRVWAEKSPEDVEAMRVNVNQYRETQHDQKFARTKGGGDMERRFTLAFPKTLMILIRTQYKSDELPFDSSFFREFGNRFPAFKVAQKI